MRMKFSPSAGTLPFISNSIRVTLLLTVVFVFFSVSISHAERPVHMPDVVKLMPNDGDVGEWEVYADTLIYAIGDDLTEIYNGIYQLYTENGVIDAAQKIYSRGNDIAIVSTHRFTNITPARRFFEYWRDSDKKQQTYNKLRILTQGYTYSSDGASNGHLYRHRYFVTVNVYIDGAEGREETEAFLRDITLRIGKLARS